MEAIREIYVLEATVFQNEAHRKAMESVQVIVPRNGDASSPWIQLLKQIPEIGTNLIIPMFLHRKFGIGDSADIQDLWDSSETKGRESGGKAGKRPAFKRKTR